MPLCRTASLPYKLNLINALHINQSYEPKDQSVKVSRKIFENWRFWKTLFFWVGHFEFYFSKKIIFFCFFPIKTCQSLLVSKDGSKFWSSQMWQHFLTQTKHFDRECILQNVKSQWLEMRSRLKNFLCHWDSPWFDKCFLLQPLRTNSELYCSPVHYSLFWMRIIYVQFCQSNQNSTIYFLFDCHIL